MIAWIILAVIGGVLFFILSGDEDWQRLIAGLFGAIIFVVVMFFICLFSEFFIPGMEVTVIDTSDIYCISMPYESASGDYMLSYVSEESLGVHELKTVAVSPTSWRLHVMIGDKLNYREIVDRVCVPYFWCMDTYNHYYITLPSLPETNASRCLW